MARLLKKLDENKKNLFRQVLLLLVVFSLLLAIALGWFVSNRQVQADGMQLAAYGEDVTAILYELNSGGVAENLEDWKEIPNLRIENYTPDETRTYKLVLTNASTTTNHTSAVSFEKFGQTKQADPKNGNAVTVKLEEQILLTEVRIDKAQSTKVASTIQQLFKDSETDRSFDLATNIRVRPNDDPNSTTENIAEILFTFKMNPDADNRYQNKLLEFEQILVTTQ